MSKITVTFDKSSEDIPTLMIARDRGYLFGDSMDIINVITGDEAVELWNKLNKITKFEVKNEIHNK